MKACFELPLIGTSEKMICRCLGVTEDDVIDVMSTLDLRTAEEVRAYTGAGDGCMGCRKRLQNFVEELSMAPAYAE